MIEKKYFDLVTDMINNNDIAPIATLENKHDWICYLGETNPGEILKELVTYLLDVQLSNIVMITYNTIDNIKVHYLDNISYEVVFENYFMNQEKFETAWSNTILTTKDIDFICFKDDENMCFSLCGKYELVQNSFSGLTYEKMMEDFIQHCSFIYPPEEGLNAYWPEFLKVYDNFNRKGIKNK